MFFVDKQKNSQRSRQNIEIKKQTDMAKQYAFDPLIQGHEEMLVVNNFFLPCNVLYIFTNNNHNFSYIESKVCKCFQLEQVQNCIHVIR